jgi:hypothetical protein
MARVWDSSGVKWICQEHGDHVGCNLRQLVANHSSLFMMK